MSPLSSDRQRTVLMNETFPHSLVVSAALAETLRPFNPRFR
jgi:hypothetical protein